VTDQGHQHRVLDVMIKRIAIADEFERQLCCRGEEIRERSLRGTEPSRRTTEPSLRFGAQKRAERLRDQFRYGYHRTQSLPGSTRARKGQPALSAPILLEVRNSGLTWIKPAMGAPAAIASLDQFGSRKQTIRRSIIGLRAALRPFLSVTAQHQRLDRQQQSLDPQQHGVHKPDRINGVQTKILGPTELARRNQLVVAGIGVDQATTSGRYSLKTAVIERFEEHS